VQIARTESGALGDDLRMVVLTDYIRAADLPRSADDVRPMARLGVVPIFEQLRRSGLGGPGLAAISGSLVIIPEAAREQLERLAADLGLAADQVRLSPLNHDPSYLRLQMPEASRNLLVRLMTGLFREGGVRILVGTKSLLGEGWDAPSINTLVLASFVGSYMLSNQMRGRAIRTQPGNPTKAANIWHLVCVEPGTHESGPDLETLARRFTAFAGVALDLPVICSGMQRLDVGMPPYDGSAIAAINARMDAHALDRGGLRQAWDTALVAAERQRIVQEVQTSPTVLPRGYVFGNTIRALVYEGLGIGGFVTAQMLRGLQGIDSGWAGVLLYTGLTFLGGAAIALPKLIRAGLLAIRHGPVAGSMRQIGCAVADALCEANLVRSSREELKIITEGAPGGHVYCSLDGGTTRERTVFLDAMGELLDPVENPRYLIMRRSPWWGVDRTDYHAVPTALGRKRGDAEALLQAWRKHVGPATLVYTRDATGRAALLRARSHSLSSAFVPRSERISRWK